MVRCTCTMYIKSFIIISSRTLKKNEDKGFSMMGLRKKSISKKRNVFHFCFHFDLLKHL